MKRGYHGWNFLIVKNFLYQCVQTAPKLSELLIPRRKYLEIKKFPGILLALSHSPPDISGNKADSSPRSTLAEKEVREALKRFESAFAPGRKKREGKRDFDCRRKIHRIFETCIEIRMQWKEILRHEEEDNVLFLRLLLPICKWITRYRWSKRCYAIIEDIHRYPRVIVNFRKSIEFFIARICAATVSRSREN